ncbi:alpha/beta hydrolase [Pontibacter sp. KCTC 32443]|uniref:alpha/beta fold hydrolase n=1 Tax=Pontibacter TaxID=323449 RepID=UPI00164EAE1A|nr:MULTISPECIES: alpha/beta hydrolase [Pontibacter]MBC5773669.1 alpha/beta hydrolase [Pontibacter sp. KCTC 32443]
MDLEHMYFHLPDVTLHAATAGDKAGQVLVFLHGFPEYWYGWHKQLSFFASQGYHIVAPDQRGYNLSSKPKEVKDYMLEKLTADIIGLIQQLGREKVVLIGHDWGGVVAWAMGMHFPHLLDKLILLNIPHPDVMQHYLRHSPRQMLKSWYAAAFQVPVLPEVVLQALNYKLLAHAMTSTAHSSTFAKEDLAAYRQAWRKPGALTGMLNWYRAFKYSRLRLNQTVEVPTLLIWGEKDAVLDAHMARQSIGRCLNGKLVFLEEATHWLHHEQPEKVNLQILSFLKEE